MTIKSTYSVTDEVHDQDTPFNCKLLDDDDTTSDVLEVFSIGWDFMYACICTYGVQLTRWAISAR